MQAMYNGTCKELPFAERDGAMTGINVDELVEHLLLFLPAMAANGAPLVTGRLLKRRGWNPHPVDGGRLFIDGKPILGKSKTFEGALAGVLTGVMVGVLIWLFKDSYFLQVGIIGGLGTVIGDMIGSFIKRRLNVPPGHDFLVLDQLDFALFVAFILWLAGFPLEPLYTLITMIVIFVLHISTNRLVAKIST